MSVDQDLEQRRKTWLGFCKLLQYSAAASAVTLILMATFLL